MVPLGQPPIPDSTAYVTCIGVSLVLGAAAIWLIIFPYERGSRSKTRGFDVVPPADRPPGRDDDRPGSRT